jgi:FlaA1/EpsC-like NDP-sugar epimerase
MVFADMVILLFALWASFSLRLGQLHIPEKMEIWILFVVPFIAIPLFVQFGLYRAIVRYIGFKALWSIIKAVSLYAVLWAALIFVSGAEGVPRSVTLINWLAAILLIGGSRMIVRWYFAGVEITGRMNKKQKRHIVIYGAGTAGRQLASVLNYSKEYAPVAFLDDNTELHKNTINALRVYSIQELDKLIIQLDIDEIFLALPSASHTRRKRIIQLLEKYPVHVRTLPSMTEVADGKIKLEDIKEIDLEDLLGRDSVLPDKELFDACIKNQSIMVTGAGGSIGSELCRQILTRQPSNLILFEQSEYNLYKAEQEFIKLINKNDSQVELVPILGNVIDAKRVAEVLSHYSINTIYHTAAYKHVPLVEHNIIEGVRVNTIGTYTVATLAMEHNVDTFILISTDKAVRPTNVMGASKRFAELVLQGLATESLKTKFSMVRFGNVLGSSGSVVPLFREQIKQGGPVTVTHQDMIRYFMTIPEAAQLVIQAGAMGTKGSGGDVFVLDMGEPVKISELASKMIHLMGFTVKDEKTPDGDIEIEYRGLRPGEKLYEELLIGDNATGTSHSRIMRAEEEAYSLDEIMSYIEQLEQAIKSSNCEIVRQLLIKVIKGYQPSSEIEDVLWKGKLTKNSSAPVVELNKYQSKQDN